jgi:hypothetical protein
VAKKSFNGIKIDPPVEEVGGKRMPEAVNAAVFGYAGFFLAR